MMKKKLMFAVLSILGALHLLSCANQVKDKGWDVTVRGKVGYPGQGTIEITELPDGKGRDTIILASNYTYEKKLHLQEPGYFRINFYNQQSVDFILDRSDLEINVDGNDPAGFVEISGSPDHDLINQVQGLLQRAQLGPEIQVMEKEFQSALQAGDQGRISELQQQYVAILDKSQDSVVSLLRSKPVSLGMINLLQSNAIDKDRHFGFFSETAARLMTEWPASRHAREFVETVEKARLTAVGQKAPEIALPDQGGQIVRLSSLQGKYVLVDFWAKWCGPCRRENPNVVAAYKKYKDKGFEVFGVSLDRSREDWLKAIEEDGLAWTHVSDLKYFESQAAIDYNINAIPFSILVDPNGIIIAKNLRGPGLERKLQQIFSKKS